MVTHLVIKEDVTAAATSKMGSGYVKVMICVQSTRTCILYVLDIAVQVPNGTHCTSGQKVVVVVTALLLPTNYSYTVEGFNCSALLVAL